MLRTILFAFICFISIPSWGQFTNLITDPSGDGNDPSLLDGTAFGYQYDAVSDSLWFQIEVANLNTTTAQAVGVNVMVNIPGAGNTFNFWGATPNTDPFHYLLTTWVTGSAPNNYSGTIGIADASGVNSSNYTNLSSNNISVSVNLTAGSITLGLKREDFFPDALFSGNSVTANIAAAVGSNQFWNDDIYSSAASLTITKSSIGLEDNGVEINSYPNPVTDIFQFENPKRSPAYLYNALGQQLKFIEPSLHQTVDVSALQTGLYFLVLEDGSKGSILKR